MIEVGDTVTVVNEHILIDGSVNLNKNQQMVIRELKINTSGYRIRKFLILYINEGSVHALKARSKLIPVNQHAALVAICAQTAGDHLHWGADFHILVAQISQLSGY